MSSPIGSEDRRPRRTSPESGTSEPNRPERSRPEHSAAEPYPANYSTAERSSADAPTEATPVYDATQTRRSAARPGATSTGATGTGASTDTHTRALNTTDADTPYAERDYTPDNERDDRPDTARSDDPAFATREMAAGPRKGGFRRDQDRLGVLRLAGRHRHGRAADRPGRRGRNGRGTCHEHRRQRRRRPGGLEPDGGNRGHHRAARHPLRLLLQRRLRGRADGPVQRRQAGLRWCGSGPSSPPCWWPCWA